jgi:hypothetical protein
MLSDVLQFNKKKGISKEGFIGDSSMAGPSFVPLGPSFASRGPSFGGASLPAPTPLESSLQNFLNTVHERYMEILQHLILTLLLFILVFVLATIEQGTMKYVAFIIFLMIFGQNLRGYAEIFGKQQVLRDILIASIGISFSVACAGFHDVSNKMDMASYLLASLTGLGASTAVLYVSDKEQGAPPFTQADTIAYGFITTIIAIYMAYDTKYLQIEASKCRGNPDYISGAMGIYLDRFRPSRANK